MQGHLELITYGGKLMADNAMVRNFLKANHFSERDKYKQNRNTPSRLIKRALCS